MPFSLQHSPVTPQLLHHVLYFLGPLSRPQLALTLGGKFGHIHLCKLLQSEGPTVETRSEANSPKDRVNLREQEKAVNGEKNRNPSYQVPGCHGLQTSDFINCHQVKVKKF